MSIAEPLSGYVYRNADLNPSHAYLLPTVTRLVQKLNLADSDKRLFDLGCGNGSVAKHFARLGYDVVGVDPSLDGIREAHRAFPDLKLYQGSAYDDLQETYGRYPIVLSLEVVEHLYSPRRFADTVLSLLQPGGTAILSTPYHGYVKNLALAVSGKLDAHFGPLWDDGHIKFWSISTLRRLLTESGFGDISFFRVGRVPSLAKSMIAVAQR